MTTLDHTPAGSGEPQTQDERNSDEAFFEWLEASGAAKFDRARALEHFKRAVVWPRVGSSVSFKSDLTAQTVMQVIVLATRAIAEPGDGNALPDEVLEAAWQAMGPVTMQGTGNMEAAIKAALSVLATRREPQTQDERESDEAFVERMRPFIEWGPEYADKNGAWSSPDNAPNASDVRRALLIARKNTQFELNVNDKWQLINTAPKDGTEVYLRSEEMQKARLKDSPLRWRWEGGRWLDQFGIRQWFETDVWPPSHWRNVCATRAIIEPGAGSEVERVARAIAISDYEDYMEDAGRYDRRARAALSAMPRPDQTGGLMRAAEIAEQIAHEFFDEETVVGRIRAEAEAIRTSAAEQGADDGWRPIKTAPRDGTEILGARHECNRWIWFGSSVWDLLEEQWSHDHDEPPTHWHPLPPSPQAAHD